MAEPNQHREEESLEAPEKLVDALNLSQKVRIFVPPTVDEAVLQRAREHLRRLERPQSRWKPWLSWAAMAACLALAVWLGERFGNPTRAGPFAREDINRDGRVDVLDAFALARRIETGGALDSRWDINGDGRVNRADVNAIAARAVSLAQAGPAPKRSADLSPHRAAAITAWRTEVRAPFLGAVGLRVNTEWGAHAPSRVVFGALAEHILAPATSNKHQEISRALHRSARRRPVQPRAAALPMLNTYPACCRQMLLVRRSRHSSENREDRS